MSWDPEFDGLLTDEVTRNPYASQDAYGQPSYGGSVTVKCRVVFKPEILRQSGSGEASGTVREVVSRAQIYCQGIIGWGLRDKITLADDSSPAILEVRTYPDEDGPHHEVVYV